ncbi:MAG: sigma 54 modulation/S30EA ribosomal C-terminal domain-containing protein, partial [Thermodesulfobacteriota bacterium]
VQVPPKASPRGRRRQAFLEESAPKRPVAVEDAMLQLKESNQPFVVFRNVESGSLNVLYRRRDGAVVLIQD